MTTLAIRLGVPADASALAALAARTFTEAFGADNTPEDLALHLARSYGAAQQGRELADPAMVTLLAEADGALAGFAQLRRGEAPACVDGPAPIEVQRFYVGREWHGRGIAQALMQRAIEEGTRAGARTVWLGVWERNPRAIAFYEKCGFRGVGTQVFTVGTDPQTDRVMMRALV